MVLEPLDTDPNLLGITPQLVKSPKSSAFRVTGINTDYNIYSTIPLFWISKRPIIFIITNQGL